MHLERLRMAGVPWSYDRRTWIELSISTEYPAHDYKDYCLLQVAHAHVDIDNEPIGYKIITGQASRRSPHFRCDAGMSTI